MKKKCCRTRFYKRFYILKELLDYESVSFEYICLPCAASAVHLRVHPVSSLQPSLLEWFSNSQPYFCSFRWRYRSINSRNTTICICIASYICMYTCICIYICSVVSILLSWERCNCVETTVICCTIQRFLLKALLNNFKPRFYFNLKALSTLKKCWKAASNWKIEPFT